MFSFRLQMTGACAAVRSVMAAVFAGLLVTMAFGVAPARADAVPFWEQSDIDAAKTTQRAKSRTSGLSKWSAKSRNVAARKKLGGYAAKTEPARFKGKRVKVAALGKSYYPAEISKPAVTGGGVRWVASSGCLDGALKSILYTIAASYGPVTVSSTCRSRNRNRAVGGAHRSKHLTGDAADFRVHGNVRAVYAYLRSSGSVGGLKHYGGGLFHIDNGARRSW
ncbi:MAG: YcbK family protein [Hyphomicrobium sp.]